MTWQEKPFIEFLNAADAVMERRYGITSDDAGMEMIASAQEAGESPEEIAEQIAQKYDLERIDR